MSGLKKRRKVNNIYMEALANVSCIRELTVDDFSLPALESATAVYNKGAIIYKVYGTKYAFMAHSDQFLKTPNEITWYEVWGINEDDARISAINLIEEDIRERIPADAYEEIQFFIKAAQGK